MINQTREEFLKKGEELFGKDKKEWFFVCPICETKQSFNDFLKHTDLEKDTINIYIGFSCIGRYAKKIGCDWTLGGFFQSHEKLVIHDAKSTRYFLFDGEKTVKPV